MKVGDYVRTNYGSIVKIEAIDEEVTLSDKGYIDKENITKSSPNIIDLIEVGDYVNGGQIEDIIFENSNATLLLTNGTGLIPIEDIKTIVTREQFESMEYRIGE